MSDLTANGRVDHLSRRELGTVRVQPTDDIVVGTYGTWTITYTVGAYGIDVGGGLKVGTRRMADWGTPQFDDPAAPNYTTVRCSAPSRLSVRFDPRGHIRPFRAVIVIDVIERPLYPGDEITVVFGDRSGASPGMQAQSFPETDCEFAVFVDPLSSGEYGRVPQITPPIRVVSGPCERIEVLAPSTAVAGEPFRVQVHGTDRFGNPTPATADELALDADPTVSFSLNESDGRAKWLDGFMLGSPGVRRLELRSGRNVLATSNPVLVRPEGEGLPVYWGDTQGQTASTVGAGTVEEYFRYARDLAGIDFCAHQGNDFMLTDEAFDEVRRETGNFHEPGRFVPFLGYEWSGATGAGGDRNVLYLDDDGPLYRSSCWQLFDADPQSERITAEAVHQAFHELAREKGRRVMLLPHVGGRRADVDVHDPGLEPLIEICSCHGIFEWRLFEALERNQKVGVIGASDDHSCRPGLAFPSTPEMAVQGGLAAVLATERTREAIWEAMYARRCYATTGPRILLELEADGRPMGTQFETESPPRISGRVCATAPLDSVSVFDRDREVLRLTPNPPKRDGRRLRVLWSGAKTQDRNRHTVWNGGLRLSAGRIEAASPLNMYAPKWGIVESRTDRLSWRSITAGNEVGVLLALDAPDDARVAFDAGPASFDFSLAKVRNEDIRESFGGVGQAVRATTLHAEGDVSDATVDVFEDDLPPGEHAYFLRVVQADFHRAWSSPIYVNLARR